MKSSLACAAATAAVLAALPASAAVSDLEGAWDNSGRSDGLAQVDITYDRSNATFRVRAAGACRPRPCDYGEAVGYALAPPGRAVTGRDVERSAIGVSTGIKSQDAERQLIITSTGKDRLQVTMIQSFRDGRAGVITTETFRRADRPGAGGGYVEAECDNVRANQVRIRYERNGWTLSQDGRTLGTFDSPDSAGFARWIIQSYDLRAKCTIPGDAGFVYWTGRNGFPQGAVNGEYCRELSGDFRVDRGRRGTFAVVDGRQTLYETAERDEAESIANTLSENRPRAQCFVGDQATGMTYFRR